MSENLENALYQVDLSEDGSIATLKIPNVDYAFEMVDGYSGKVPRKFRLFDEVRKLWYKENFKKLDFEIKDLELNIPLYEHVMKTEFEERRQNRLKTVYVFAGGYALLFPMVVSVLTAVTSNVDTATRSLPVSIFEGLLGGIIFPYLWYRAEKDFYKIDLKINRTKHHN